MKVVARRRDGYIHDVDIEAGRHALVVDEPEVAGGTDAGPAPTRLVAAGLASCISITMEMYARRKGWDIGAVEVEETVGLGKVSVVGAGLRSQHGVAARLFRALDEHGVEVQLVSTSPIRITCLVRRDDVERGVRALHDAFSPAALAP